MLKDVAEQALEFGRKYVSMGTVADYIPELKKADPEKLGLCIFTEDGERICVGDVDQRFTMQSICKVVTLSVALQILGKEEVFQHVLMEPSGDAFNSILKLDTASNRPFNPMINAGAIEVISLLAPAVSFEELKDYTRRVCMDLDISLNEEVYHSEYMTGNRNRAIGYLLKSKDVLKGDVSATVDLYFRMCSLSVNARSLAGLSLVLSCGGVNPETGTRIFDKEVCRIVKTLMLTCGMYDGSGEFAVRTGIPAKSGVGGGVTACGKKGMGIGTYGPALNLKGNSIGGIHALEYLSRELGLHILDIPDGSGI